MLTDVKLASPEKGKFSGVWSTSEFRSWTNNPTAGSKALETSKKHHTKNNTRPICVRSQNPERAPRLVLSLSITLESDAGWAWQGVIEWGAHTTR